MVQYPHSMMVYAHTMGWMGYNHATMHHMSYFYTEYNAIIREANKTSKNITGLERTTLSLMAVAGLVSVVVLAVALG